MSQAAPPRVSLILLSRGRPALLARCLTAVAQMDHPAFEVIVVADPAGLAVARSYPVRTVAFGEANISAARNLGIAAAAGDIVAFTDDDAVPEPLWLWHLTRPFSDPAVFAAGGHVLGWNGLSFEWTGGLVDRALNETRWPQGTGGTTVHANRPGQAVEVKGVNCAYRRDRVLQLGGFDPQLRYYLDETELNLRLANLHGLTAIVPDARVHHMKAESDQRHADRVPKTLYDIGYSTAITLGRHDHGATEPRQQRRQEQVTKLETYLRARRMTDAQAQALLLSYDQGFAAGAAVGPALIGPMKSQAGAFLPFPAQTRPLSILSGRSWQRRALVAKARTLAEQGHIVRVFAFSPTALYHQRRFEGGVWVQRGGLFGKSLRTDPVFRWWRFSRRLSRESALFLSGFRKT